MYHQVAPPPIPQPQQMPMNMVQDQIPFNPPPAQMVPQQQLQQNQNQNQYVVNNGMNVNGANLGNAQQIAVQGQIAQMNMQNFGQFAVPFPGGNGQNAVNDGNGQNAVDQKEKVAMFRDHITAFEYICNHFPNDVLKSNVFNFERV